MRSERRRVSVINPAGLFRWLKPSVGFGKVGPWEARRVRYDPRVSMETRARARARSGKPLSFPRENFESRQLDLAAK